MEEPAAVPGEDAFFAERGRGEAAAEAGLHAAQGGLEVGQALTGAGGDYQWRCERDLGGAMPLAVYVAKSPVLVPPFTSA